MTYSQSPPLRRTRLPYIRVRYAPLSACYSSRLTLRACYSLRLTLPSIMLFCTPRLDAMYFITAALPKLNRSSDHMDDLEKYTTTM